VDENIFCELTALS